MLVKFRRGACSVGPAGKWLQILKTTAQILTWAQQKGLWLLHIGYDQ